jgi:hypothetical protein
MGGKVLVPTSQFLRTLISARLAADVMGVPTVLIARTDADSAKLLLSDVDPYDAPFLTRERTAEGFWRLKGGVECAVARAVAYAPYADMLWCETSKPDLEEARAFAEGVHAKYPDKMLAYNCSPSFNWKKNLDDATIARFQRELGAMGYRFQFVTLAGFHALNFASYQLAEGYRDRGMAAYTELQQAEFTAERTGYTATRHQREVGTGYFDQITEVISAGKASTKALVESTEAAQFSDSDRLAAAQHVHEEEHANLHRLTARLKAAKEMPAILAALQEMQAALEGHFAREESPQGLHGLVHARAPEFRGAFDKLMTEHSSILAAVDKLIDRAQKGEAGGAVEGVGKLAARLKEHELREDEIARAALDPRRQSATA